jgi:hypothetical protein
MAPKVVSQKRFVRGVNATTPTSGQVPGSVPRASNLLYTVRGGFRTCDGSLALSLHGGSLTTTDDPILDVFYYKPSGDSANYFAITKDTTTHLTVPVAPTLTQKNITNTIAAAPTGAVRSAGVVTITNTGVHNMDSTYIGATINISGVTDTSFNGNVVFTGITSTTAFTYAQSTLADATSRRGNFKGTLVPATTYSYRITALDGAGGRNDSRNSNCCCAARWQYNLQNHLDCGDLCDWIQRLWPLSSGTETLLLDGTNTQTISGAPTSPTYYDMGNTTPSATYPNPTVNNTQVAQFVNLNVPAVFGALPGSWGLDQHY